MTKLILSTDAENNFMAGDMRVNEQIGLVEFRTLNGSENNLANPEWGEAGIPLLRLTPADYEDGLSVPRGGDPSSLPNPREISNIVLVQTDANGNHIDILNERGVSDWFWQWGQFLDHDIDLTEPAVPLEPFNIEVPTGDPFFDPLGTGTQTIRFNRSIFASNTGTDSSNPRQQVNEIKAFIDASQVYGSDEATADSLREWDGTGKLRTSSSARGEVLLPTDAESNFMAGDIRVNEQIGLTAVHTLFVREHNRLADYIGTRLNNGDPELQQLYTASGLNEGNFIYEAARMVVGAEIQAITYNEFLPLLLGERAISNYTGYDDTVNPGIANEFSTAAFRLGHTMLSPQLLRVGLDDNGEATREEIPLRDAFFTPANVIDEGVDSLFVGLNQQQAQELDGRLIDDVRNFLFGSPGAGGFDLGALNIQRGRDHGLLGYTDFRKEFGLNNGLGKLSKEDKNRIRDAYPKGNIREIDLWVGGIAEKHLNGALVGQTFHKILVDQFTRLRDGDRFFYENQLDILEIFYNGTGNGDEYIGDITLSDIITANIDSSLLNLVSDTAFLV